MNIYRLFAINILRKNDNSYHGSADYRHLAEEIDSLFFGRFVNRHIGQSTSVYLIIRYRIYTDGFIDNDDDDDFVASIKTSEYFLVKLFVYQLFT